MAEEIDKEALRDLFRARSIDRRKATTRRRRRTQAVPESFADTLKQYFKKDPFVRYRIEQARAILAWERVVGEAAAKVSTPLRIRGHRLIVSVQNPLWKQQLLLLKSQIVGEYRKLFPRLKISEIFFVSEDIRSVIPPSK